MMLVDGVLSHGPMSDSYLLQRPECSWMLLDGVLSHGAMSDSYVCSWSDLALYVAILEAILVSWAP